MSKILTVLTGGTIGSMNDGIAIDTNRYSSTILLNKYYEQFGNEDELVAVQPLNILSENLELHHWEELVNFVLEYDIDGFDGIIITHGSDTLSYSSAMLSMCLQHLPIPVVITAANYIVTDERSNAMNNFRSSVVLCRLFTRGIFTVFGDRIGKSRVFLPTRILEADGITDTFQSLGGGELGFVNGDKFEPTPLDFNPTKEQIEQPKERIIPNRLSLNKRVLMIRQYPGLDFENILIAEDIGAVLIITYHSQTARTQGKGNVLKLIEKCSNRGIPVYCAPFKARREYYATSLSLMSFGCRPMYDISPESAYAKLLLECNI